MITKARTFAPLAALAVALALPAGAGAATFTATRVDDPLPDGCLPFDCSLREAIVAANAQPGADEVVLPAPLYRLAVPNADANDGEDAALEGDLDLSGGALTVTHPGAGRATIDANGLDRVFEIFAGAPATLTRITVTGGAVPVSAGGAHDGDGGGILASAGLMLDRSRVRDNLAGFAPNDGGGGIALSGATDLRLERSKVAGNQVGGDGGGIEAPEIRRLVLERTTVSDNTGGSAGGGILLGTVGEPAPSSRISKSTIAGNTVAGSPGADGGGILLSSGTLRIQDSTISGNAANDRGGGLNVEAGARLFAINSTLANNIVAGMGGAISASGQTGLNSVTVARNVADADADAQGSGGGLFNDAGQGFELENSLIALNRLGPSTPDDCAGDAFDSDGDNLISATGMCLGIDFAGDIVRPNPHISQLGRHGGETNTIALRRRSPAVGEAGTQSSPKRDQRGVRRDDEPDIGAYELARRRGGGGR